MPAMQASVRRRIPNLVTLLRIALAAGFFVALGAYRFPGEGVGWGTLAIGIFLVAAATDALDGYLARRWNVESMFGRIMDPFCDKVLVLGAFILLAGPRFSVPGGDIMASGVYPWMVVVIIARELLVTAIRDVMESRGHSGAARWPGKIKMVLQSLAIPIVLAIAVGGRPDKDPTLMWTVDALVWTTLVVTVLSGIPYCAGLRDMLRDSSQ